MTEQVVNELRDDETMRQFHARIIGQYPADKVEKAVAFLREQWKNAPMLEELRKAIATDPENWASPVHMFWGMAVRNELRHGGFGEDYWPIWNLDDIYVPLVERAVAP